MRPPNSILAINGGSSSIRFAVYEAGEPLRRRLDGKIERIGSRGTRLIAREDGDSSPVSRPLVASDHGAAVRFLIRWLESQAAFASVTAVGHRVVHGMRRSAPARITPGLIAALRRVMPYDPDHIPHELALVEAFARRRPRLAQVACFDTAFHRAMPRVAKLLPIPRRYAVRGVERYGFHGLSYAYLMEELARLDATSARGRVILAHLGGGASLAAVRDGKSVDTTMGFTPTGGLVMGTRTGDLDPGIAYYLWREHRMTPARFHSLVNHESGLLGVSATSSDVRELCATEAKDVRAAEALDLFCYQVKKAIGAFAAVLGGVETLVFAAGIGENSPVIRARICAGLDFLGVELDATRNAGNQPVISTRGGRVTVRVIRTDEELMIARSVAPALGRGARRGTIA